MNMSLYEVKRRARKKAALVAAFKRTRLIGTVFGISYDVQYDEYSRSEFANTADMFPWRAEFSSKTVKLVAPYWTGSAWIRPPEPEEVLHSLFMEASMYDASANFADWANDCGLSSDSVKAHDVYSRLAEQAKTLRHLFGDKYNDLIVLNEDEFIEQTQASIREADTTKRYKPGRYSPEHTVFQQGPPRPTRKEYQ